MGKLQARIVASPAGRPHARAVRAALLAAALGASLGLSPPAQVPATVAQLVDAGRFAEAEAAIAAGLAAPAVQAAQADALRWQRERMRRILIDFTLDRAGAFARVQRQVPDLREDEFARWDAAGLLEKRVIDGRTLYFGRAPSNLFRLSPEAFARRKPATPLVDGPMERVHPHHRAVRDAAAAGTALPEKRVSVVQTLEVEADAVPAGETVRAWIPVPREIAGQQRDVRLAGTTPATHQLAAADAAMRTVYMEAPAVAGQPTRFEARYDVTVTPTFQRTEPPGVRTSGLGPVRADDLGERPPHIVFTPALRAFSAKVVGGETDKWAIAQKLYAAVDRIPWAGALEYSTIPNIPEYAMQAGHADCGQQTLLLMALLRLNGIPARWQSGMVFSDGSYDNLHDWGWMHVAPWGWIPMDVTTGRLDDADAAIAGFYLGGLDAYRIAFNDDWGRGFSPAKLHPRSDDVDSQRGEAEWSGGNLYYDQWDYTFVATPQP